MQQVQVSRLRTFLGALLIGGTALGAGMLGLPIATAGSGLIPSWIIYLVCWTFSLCTGLLFVEIGLWLPKKANIVSMATKILGKPGKWCAWILYIFLFYCLTLAYVSEGGRVVVQMFGGEIPYILGVILFTGFFGFFVYLGTKAAGRLNGILMAGLIVSFILFLIMGSMHVTMFPVNQWGFIPAILGLPVIFTSFSYQGTVPSLFDYLGRHPKKMRVALVFGTLIPFIAYIVWDFIVKGIVPVHGMHGLLATKAAGLSAVQPLSYFLHNPYVLMVSNFFGFFALTTSFIGVTLGLFDFLIDGLKLKHSGGNKVWVALLIYIPPVIVSLVDPAIFLTALNYAGGFGCALLLGLLPVTMVWVGRYRLGYSNAYQQIPGGKVTLSLLALFVIVEVVIAVISQIGLYSS